MRAKARIFFAARYFREPAKKFLFPLKSGN